MKNQQKSVKVPVSDTTLGLWTQRQMSELDLTLGLEKA